MNWSRGNKHTAAPSRPMGAPQALPDPRIMLAMVFLTGTCLWQVPPRMCLVLGCLVCGAFVHWHRRLSLPPRTLGRLAKFILFWVLLKVLLQYIPLALSATSPWNGDASTMTDTEAASAMGESHTPLASGYWQTVTAFLLEHSDQLYETGLFCVQLTTLVLLGILLAGLFSAHSLACAFNWYLRPLPLAGSWRLALALALLLHYLPRIYDTLDTIRTTAIMRNLPSTGFAYWKLAFPRFFSSLAEQTWAQAIAVASRNLDSPVPWTMDTAIPTRQALLFCLYSALLVASIFMPSGML